jgi:1-deoxy-D-xylulose-5-phosphate reductoisomerase
MKNIAILGSTGSIGTQALDVVRANKDKFKVEVLTAFSNIELLAAQAVEFDVNTVVIQEESKYEALKSLLSNTDIKVFCGEGSGKGVMIGCGYIRQEKGGCG